jgi:YHS domain-containing protein
MLKGFLAARQSASPPPPPGTLTHQDPVCGVFVADDDAIVGKIDGNRIYFCSMACLEKYQEQLK